MHDDQRLICKLKQGCQETFCSIYEQYRDDLLRLATSLLCQKGLAEDTVHDVFLFLVRTVPTLQLRGSLKSYLMSSVANRARNLNRFDARHPSESLDEALGVLSQHPRPEQWIIASEETQQWIQRLACLPYEQREVIILHLQGEMTFKEIARMQKISIKTVQSRYRYGLEKLRSSLNSEVII